MQENFRNNSENEPDNSGITNDSHIENENPLEKNRNDQNTESIKESIQTDKEGSLPQAETTERKEESFKAEEKTNSEEVEGNLSDSGKNEEPPRYSSTYAPPYYIPNFTVNDPAAGKNATEPPKKKKSGVWIAQLVVVCVIICGLVGLAGGYVGARLARNMNDSRVSSYDCATIVKNNGSIKVNEVVGSTGYDNLTVAQVAQMVADSVVEITTSKVQTNPYYGQYVTGGAGSGVIITQGETTAYIVTNYHVIEGADSIVVRLTNGKEYGAKVMDGDAQADIAMLVIEIEKGTQLTKAVLGSSSSLRVGDGVVAIGNPLGQLGGTVTDGIVSALERSVSIEGNVMTLLQHNAAINPGNPGGGLFNMAGELVGIINAKESESGIEGLGFAIPIDTVYEPIILNVIENGYISGMSSLEIDVEYGTLDQRLFPYGVYIVNVNNANSGLKRNDMITKIGNRKVESESDYYAILKDIEIGSTVEITVMRLSGIKQVEVTVEVTVVERHPAS